MVVILNEWELAELIAAYERFPENSVRKRREELTELYDEWFGKPEGSGDQLEV